MTSFRNPHNGYVLKVSSGLTPLWVALFGWAYWTYQGIWTHAALSLFAYGFLFAMGWWPAIAVVMAVYAAGALDIIDKHYLASGWSRVGDASPEASAGKIVAVFAAIVGIAFLSALAYFTVEIYNERMNAASYTTRPGR